MPGALTLQWHTFRGWGQSQPTRWHSRTLSNAHASFQPLRAWFLPLNVLLQNEAHLPFHFIQPTGFVQIVKIGQPLVPFFIGEDRNHDLAADLLGGSLRQFHTLVPMFDAVRRFSTMQATHAGLVVEAMVFHYSKIIAAHVTFIHFNTLLLGKT